MVPEADALPEMRVHGGIHIVEAKQQKQPRGFQGGRRVIDLRGKMCDTLRAMDQISRAYLLQNDIVKPDSTDRKAYWVCTCTECHKDSIVRQDWFRAGKARCSCRTLLRSSKRSERVQLVYPIGKKQRYGERTYV